MAITLLVSLSLLGPPVVCPVPVCSCVLPGPVSAARAGDEAIFEGRVLQVRDTVIWRTEGPRLVHVRHRWRVVTLRVDRVWNGAASGTVQVFTGLGGGDCGYPFNKDEAYVVFAADFNGLLVTSICTHTTEATKAATIRDSLGTPLHERGSDSR